MEDAFALGSAAAREQQSAQAERRHAEHGRVRSAADGRDGLSPYELDRLANIRRN